MRELWRQPGLFTYAIFAVLFLYLPILVLVVYSFNENASQTQFSAFSLKWYAALLSNERVLTAAGNSLLVAALSALVATVLGTLLAVGMWRYKFRGQQAVRFLFFVPVIIPEVVMGISFLALFNLLGVRLSLLTVIISHITFCLPFAALVVQARLEDYDLSLEDAARDLGASRFTVFTRITLPVLWPGIAGGALLAATISLDDVIISFFVSGPTSTTLPVKIFSMVRAGVKPDINALSTLMLVGTLTLAYMAHRLRNSSRNF